MAEQFIIKTLQDASSNDGGDEHKKSTQGGQAGGFVAGGMQGQAVAGGMQAPMGHGGNAVAPDPMSGGYGAQGGGKTQEDMM